MILRRRTTAALLTLTAGLVLAGCSGSGGGSKSSAPTSSAAPSTPAAASSTPVSAGTFPPAPGAPARQYYVSIGDSYAAGFQPTTAAGKGATNRNGFAYQVAAGAKVKGYDYTLVNFGCSGATTASVLTQAGCRQPLLGPGAASYSPKTQAAAAEAFLKAHRGQVGLITVSIGGNDVTPCGARTDTIACLSNALGVVGKNLATLLTGLRAAAGPSTRLVGITYPDVLLGDTLSKDPARQSTAKLSVLAFQSLINPQFKKLYEGAGGKFVDVTAATGGYGPLTQTTTLAPYGTIPVPVAKICELTYYCQLQDIHPRTPGYKLIADLVLGTLPHH